MFLRRTTVLFTIIAGLLSADTPEIGRIEIYGLRKVPEPRVRKALGVMEGSPLPSSKAAIEERLTDIPGIAGANLEATCCEDGRVVLYVGIEERGARHFALRTPPEEELELPEEITHAYRDFLTAVAEAVRRGSTAEDLTNGHSLMADPDCRDIQLKFVELARAHLKEISAVLRRSADEEQRAIAAYVIGYAPRKYQVVDDLQFALRDMDQTVRGNAIRALAALAVFAKLHPDEDLKIAPTWFVEMLNSPVWTDRNNAAVALVNLTESRDASTLDQLRQRALPALVEMAKWRQLAHALPAFIILGRVAGYPEQEIQDIWSRDERDKLIAAVVKKFRL